MEFKITNENRDCFSLYNHVESKLLYRKVDESLPKVSIIIPTYKRYNELIEAIKSVVKQIKSGITYEILILDNNSPKTYVSKTIEFIRVNKYSNILYYQNKSNIGMFGNWNRGVKLARGEWIVFLHDDDILHEEYLRNIKRFIDIDSIDGLCSNTLHFDDEKKIMDIYNEYLNRIDKKFLYKNHHKKIMKMNRIDSIILNSNPYGEPTCGLILRKNYIIELGGFDEKFFPISDWVFLYKYNEKYKLYKPFFTTGYYRWGINESLKLDTIHGFMAGFESMRSYCADNSLVGKIMYKFFRNEQHIVRLETLSTLIQNINLSKTDFNYICEYKKNVIKYLTYKAIYKSYWKFKKVRSLLF